MNESRQLSHLASVWIIRYCYSCGASCCALPQAMWKSWMTVKKDSDELMDFCEGAWKHSEGSCVDACACCLLGDVRDMMCRGCFFCLWFRASQSYRKMMWIRDWFILFYFFCKWKLPQYAWGTENETFEQIVALCVVNGHLWRYVLTSLNILSWLKHLLLCFTTNVPFLK